MSIDYSIFDYHIDNGKPCPVCGNKIYWTGNGWVDVRGMGTHVPPERKIPVRDCVKIGHSYVQVGTDDNAQPRYQCRRCGEWK